MAVKGAFDVERDKLEDAYRKWSESGFAPYLNRHLAVEMQKAKADALAITEPFAAAYQKGVVAGLEALWWIVEGAYRRELDYISEQERLDGKQERADDGTSAAVFEATEGARGARRASGGVSGGKQAPRGTPPWKPDPIGRRPVSEVRGNRGKGMPRRAGGDDGGGDAGGSAQEGEE